MNEPIQPLLSTQVAALEAKAAQLDIAVEKIMELKAYLADPSPSDQALIQAVERLVQFYEPASKAFQAKLQADGYQQGPLLKYVDSRWNGALIRTVKVTKAGQLSVALAEQEVVLGQLPADCAYDQSLDTLLCHFSYLDALDIQK